jgi:iron complex outermembrane receptor protein/vitamin B12 transporter
MHLFIGRKGPATPVFRPATSHRPHFDVSRLLCCLSCVLVLAIASTILHAGIIRGTVTDTTGATVKGATIVLLNGSNFVSTTVSGADGSFQFVTGQSGRFALNITADGFRQLQPPAFYAAAGDQVERNLVLEPEWVHQSIVVTATGTPLPQQQTSESTTVLGPLDFPFHEDLVDELRMIPGAVAVQTGQLGSQASLFIRGGPSDDSQSLVDGVDVADIGGQFDFGPYSTLGISSAEILRGPDSDLYGADAGSGVISFSTPKGQYSYPTLRLAGDLGNFALEHESAELAGAHKKLDYYGAFSWLQSTNNLPNDRFHVATAAGNFGWQPLSSIQVRGTVHYGVDATGIPNAWNFYHVADDATQKDQDLFVSGSVDDQTTADFHNSVRYGLTRKREQYYLWQHSGEYIEYIPPSDGYPASYAYFGNAFTIKGANGSVASGRAILDYPEVYPFSYQLVNNRDQIAYQGDYRFTPHIVGLIGFHYEDERGLESIPTYATDDTVERRNYLYLASVHGDFRGRFFYTLGGSLEHYSLFGVQTTPHAGLSAYIIKPRHGLFSGTRVLFNYGDGVREATLPQQFGSLYQFFLNNNDLSLAQELHISKLAAPTTRTYEGGVQQDFFSDRLVFKSSYFHNEFGKQIESVGGMVLVNILPDLTSAQKQQLISALQYYYTDDYGLYVNSMDYRAQGIETTVEGGIGSHIFLRGGYTYTDAVIQRSFDSDNEALTGGYAPTYNGIPIGAYSPLKGARPFRIPPQTGFITGSYTGKRWTILASGAFSSRSDDSTFLAYSDLSGGNSLLLPNRNLDYGFAKLDLGGNFKLFSWLGIYAQTENLLSERRIAPIGYPSLPFNYHAGLKIRLSKHDDD